jgi:hypothetical protein
MHVTEVSTKTGAGFPAFLEFLEAERISSSTAAAI